MPIEKEVKLPSLEYSLCPNGDLELFCTESNGFDGRPVTHMIASIQKRFLETLSISMVTGQPTFATVCLKPLLERTR